MKEWWSKRSLRMRLTLWYAATSFIILIALGTLLLALVRQRLGAELDRQLRGDVEFVDARLEHDEAGRIRLDYENEDNQGAEHFAKGENESERTQSAVWFEVWSPDGSLLLHRRPGEARSAGPVLSPPSRDGGRHAPARIFSAAVSRSPVRVLESEVRVDDSPATLRVIRSEAELRRALAEIGVVLALGLPLAALLSAVAGYFIAGRSLAPLGAMAARARQITAERLNARLPVLHPHDELGQLAMIFNEMLRRLENSFAELRRFTADASHELRTPLMALRAVGEASLRNDNGENEAGAWREAVGSMLEEAQYLSELVDALLLLARGDSDAATPQALEPVALGPLLGDARESLLALAEDKGQRIVVEIGQSVCGVTARADRALLRQAVFNLVHNAIRYSPADGAIRLRLLREERGDQALVIEVADEGPGIAAEHQEKVFERFYRIDRARSHKEGHGAGLGLAIARWAIERQGGRIELKSAPGAGSTFRVILPAANVAET